MSAFSMDDEMARAQESILSPLGRGEEAKEAAGISKWLLLIFGLLLAGTFLVAAVILWAAHPATLSGLVPDAAALAMLIVALVLPFLLFRQKFFGFLVLGVALLLLCCLGAFLIMDSSGSREAERRYRRPAFIEKVEEEALPVAAEAPQAEAKADAATAAAAEAPVEAAGTAVPE